MRPLAPTGDGAAMLTRTPQSPIAPDGWRITSPSEPFARRSENRGRLWLVLGFVLCPCHLPVTLALLGATLGGTAVGSFLTTSNWRLGVILAVLYGLTVWRGFVHLRRAKALGVTDCRDGACDLPSVRSR
jgi:mercuric ion transport protein